jgi:hypothetical protein
MIEEGPETSMIDFPQASITKPAPQTSITAQAVSTMMGPIGADIMITGASLTVAPFQSDRPALLHE